MTSHSYTHSVRSLGGSFKHDKNGTVVRKNLSNVGVSLILGAL